jgi:ATP-dependent Lhr-like helicase
MNIGTGVADPGDFLADLLGLRERRAIAMSEVEAAFVGRYGAPTELQRSVEAAVRADGSCLVIAPPASGKTEAAIMPLTALQRLSGRAILYVCPTRALINDVVARLESGFAALDRTIVARHGESKRAASTYAQASCVVLTPESLQSLVVGRDPLLGRTGYVVLDELHSLEGTARGTQLRIVLRRLRDRIDPPPLVIALSATVSNPAEMAATWGSAGAPMAIVSQGVGVGQSSVLALSGGVDGLKSWLRRPGAPAKVLAFANSRRHCDELFRALKGTSGHVPLIHYSDLERADRLATEDLLRSLPSVVCIATSTLELGIDVGDIDTIVLADAPWSTRNLFQRIGRGGRRSGITSTVCFPGSARDLLRLVAAMGTPVGEDDDAVTPIFPSVLVQQVLVTILADERGRISPVDLEGPLASVGLSKTWAGGLLAHLRDLDVLMVSPGGRKFELSPSAERLLRSDVWGNFPVDSGGWELRASGRRLATVQLPVRPYVGLGILFAGRTWRVLGVQRRTLSLVQDENVASPESPVYRDPSPLISWRLADQMRRLLAGEDVPPGVQLDGATAERLQSMRDRFGRAASDVVLMGRGERGPKLLTFAGSRVNYLLATLMPEASGADELGITMQRDISPTAWGKLSAAFDSTTLADRAWPRLAQQVSVNRWFEFLPLPLQREEVVSQFLSSAVLDRLRSVMDRAIMPAPGAGEPL